ncbi:MAG: hypothetical protein PHO80_02890, partial [Candidatus Gracilibacteria bacterium]|nr:hypothetical protein [Candidatus Gracilibacteria bacterium]
KYKSNFFKKDLIFLKTKKENYLICVGLLILGLITSGTIYFALKNQFIPPSNDILIHQKIIQSIRENKNVNLETVNPYFINSKTELYPFAFHTTASLTQKFQTNQYKSSYVEILLLTIILPLSVFIFTNFIFKNKIIAFYSSIAATTFGYFPYWSYGWGGYPLTLSLIVLPITLISLIKLTINKNQKYQFSKIFITALLLIGLYYIHISELIYSLPIFYLIYILINRKKISPHLFKKLIYITIIFSIAALYSIKPHLNSFQNYQKIIPQFYEKHDSLNTVFQKSDYIDKPYHILFNNPNRIFSYIFIIGLLILILKIKKKSNLFFLISLFIFTFFLSNFDTQRFLDKIFIIKAWTSWERLGDHFIYLLSPITAYGIYIIQKKFKIPSFVIILILILLIIDPIKNNYSRLLSVGQQAQFQNNEKRTIEWINSNLSSNNIILNKYQLGSINSNWWLPIMTQQKLLFPYTSHLDPGFKEKDKVITNIILNPQEKTAFINMMKETGSNYAIANKEDSINNIPLVNYFNQTPCLNLLYPNPKNIYCKYIYDENNNELLLTPDSELSYLYKFDPSCNNQEYNICSNSPNIVNISKLNVSGNKYGLEKDSDYFFWFSNFATINIPKNIRNQISIEIRRPNNINFDLFIFNENKLINKININQNGWNQYLIKINPTTDKKIILFTTHNYQPKNDSRSLSFSIRNIYF